MTLEFRNLRLEHKKATGDATFSGYGNVANVVDSDNDVFDPGAWAADLRERGSRRPVLLFHDTTRPVGFVDVKETDRGLYGDFTLIDGVPDANMARKLVDAKVLNELSVGYLTEKAFNKNGVRHITQAKLYEISIVLWAANPQSVIDADEKALRTITETLRNLTTKAALETAFAAGLRSLKA